MKTQLVIRSQASQRYFPTSLQGFSINNEAEHNEDKYFAMNGRFFTQEKAIQIKDTLVSLFLFTFISFSWHISELKEKPFLEKKSGRGRNIASREGSLSRMLPPQANSQRCLGTSSGERKVSPRRDQPWAICAPVDGVGEARHSRDLSPCIIIVLNV